MNKYFYEVFENIPRQGPGLNSSTQQAFKIIQKDLPEVPEILDVGCGKGVQTLKLAELCKGNITAIDTNQPFLDAFADNVRQMGFEDKIQIVNADMTKMAFSKTFDLIWSEGAVFIIGIKEGLKQWKKHLNPGGFLVLTDLLWLGNERPDELTKYFEEECMYVLTVEEAIQEAELNGYTSVDHFTLPLEGWTTAYLLPQQKIIQELRKKYAGITEATETFDSLEYERETVYKYHEYFGYEFLILRME